jgi:hypothetical protein
MKVFFFNEATCEQECLIVHGRVAKIKEWCVFYPHFCNRIFFYLGIIGTIYVTNHG